MKSFLIAAAIAITSLQAWSQTVFNPKLSQRLRAYDIEAIQAYYSSDEAQALRPTCTGKFVSLASLQRSGAAAVLSEGFYCVITVNGNDKSQTIISVTYLIEDGYISKVLDYRAQNSDFIQ